MKHDSDDFKVIFAHVEFEKVRFNYGKELGIDFQNEIDAWTKMEIVFRQQIKSLKDNRKVASKIPKNRADLQSFVYSFREKIE